MAGLREQRLVAIHSKAFRTSNELLLRAACIFDLELSSGWARKRCKISNDRDLELPPLSMGEQSQEPKTESNATRLSPVGICCMGKAITIQ